MRYGCIGEHLSHSFSKEVHRLIANYDYCLCELKKDEVEPFIKSSDFIAINVTIPYKEAVMPYLSEIDKGAELIGAVNTVLNKNGRLLGFNTDFFGMKALAEHAGISLGGKKVLILGTGGTSKTAYAVALSEGAKEILKVSRTPSNDSISYTDVYNFHTDAEIIINTTPVGMFPNIYEKPIELSKFKRLSGVLDVVYNPLNTPLVLEAKNMGIAAEGGLYMLVAQGVRASEIFLDTTYDRRLIDETFAKIERDKKNIVLIGMPSCGKTTVGRILAEKLKRRFVDTDEIIVATAKKEISDIFATDTEVEFRKLEEKAVKAAATNTGSVISCGGGVILNPDNMKALSENGRIYFIDRPTDALIPTFDRPTASTREKIERIYSERYSIYKSYADSVVLSLGTAEDAANKILADFQI